MCIYIIIGICYTIIINLSSRDGCRSRDVTNAGDPITSYITEMSRSYLTVTDAGEFPRGGGGGRARAAAAVLAGGQLHEPGGGLAVRQHAHAQRRRRHPRHAVRHRVRHEK